MTACKRVVLYGRVSADDRDGRPVDDQLAQLRAWAVRDGMEVVAEHRDDGISASRFARKAARPGWQDVLDVIASGKADGLAVWEVSRSTRDRAVWAALVAGLIDAGAVLVVDGRVHDPADPDDGFMLDLGAALAVREVAMMSKRVRRGMASRAASGKPNGRAPYGVRAEHDPETGRVVRYVKDPERAAVITEAAGRILAGENPTAVAHDLNRREVPAPAGGQWIGNNLLRLLANPSTAGLRVHRGRVLDDVTAVWPALVTMEQHQRLQQLMTDPTRRTHRDGSHVKHLLTGVGHCDVCGGPLGTLVRRRATDRVVTYRCRERFCIGRRADAVDEFVERLVIERLSRPDFAAALARRSEDPTIHEANEEAARLRARLDEARRLVDADRLSLESLADLEARTLPRLRIAEERARPRHVPGVVFDAAGADAATRWEATPIAMRRQITRSLMDVRIGRSAKRGRGDGTDLESIRIVWRT